MKLLVVLWEIGCNLYK